MGAPLSEAYGRRPLFVWGGLIFTLFTGGMFEYVGVVSPVANGRFVSLRRRQLAHSSPRPAILCRYAMLVGSHFTSLTSTHMHPKVSLAAFQPPS